MYTRAVALLLLASCTLAQAETNGPTVTVIGHGIAQSAPDQATVILTAIAQEKHAARAQARVNGVMAKAAKALAALGIPSEALSTMGITLLPLSRNGAPRRPGEFIEPRIDGYQATNRLAVRLDKVAQVGVAIDHAVKAGVNQIESVIFGVKDDRTIRRDALADATREAHLHAETIASAMGMRLLAVEEAQERLVGLPIPMSGVHMESDGRDIGTPVQGGQVRVEATVTIRYRIGREVDSRRGD